MIRSDEISEVLKQRIRDFDVPMLSADVGIITQVGDGIAHIYGLRGCMAGELLQFPGDTLGMALNLEQDSVGAVIMGPYQHLSEGDEVRTTGRVMEVPVGEALIGRIVNGIGQPIDERGPINTDKFSKADQVAPGVIKRKNVRIPLQTGLKAIDAMIPIGRGQRELIIGDRQTGKTAIGIDAIINQKGKDVYCIYCAIAQSASSVARVADTLERAGAMEYTTIVSATASEPAALKYLAPYTACSIGEYFRDNGKHALVVYDDLSKHAEAYREISLLLRRPPGREAYPGDVFYLHSRLLERAAQLSDALGGGTLTALPIIETKAGDVSGYIPTNVISITDGQIYLESDLFYAGIRPAVSVGLSVSRVGGDAQTKAMKKVAGQLRLDLAQYRTVAAFAQFASDLDAATRKQLDRGRRMTELLKQHQYAPMSLAEQVLVLYAGTRGYLDDIPAEAVTDFEEKLMTTARSTAKQLLDTLADKKEIDDAIEAEIKKVIEDFKKGYAPPEKSALGG